jgi:hypothetical protein
MVPHDEARSAAADPGPAWTTASLRAHVERQFATAAVERLPFPHIVIPNFLPADVFDDALRFNLFLSNAGREWISKSDMADMRTPTPYDHRKQINFAADAFDASPSARAFWGMIRATFLDGDWFPKLVIDKYPDYFLIRFGEAMLRDDFLGRLRKELFLQRHDPDYFIGPHTDVPGRIFTCIFSFCDRPGFESFGTQLMRHQDPYVRCWGRNHYLPEGFEVVKTADYSPNNFLLFFKTRQSFHAVKTITADVPNQRYGMQFQLFEPPGGVFRDLSHPDLMEGRHKKDAASGQL